MRRREWVGSACGSRRCGEGKKKGIACLVSGKVIFGRHVDCEDGGLFAIVRQFLLQRATEGAVEVCFDGWTVRLPSLAEVAVAGGWRD